MNENNNENDNKIKLLSNRQMNLRYPLTCQPKIIIKVLQTGKKCRFIIIILESATISNWHAWDFIIVVSPCFYSGNYFDPFLFLDVCETGKYGALQQ